MGTWLSGSNLNRIFNLHTTYEFLIHEVKRKPIPLSLSTMSTEGNRGRMTTSVCPNLRLYMQNPLSSPSSVYIYIYISLPHVRLYSMPKCVDDEPDKERDGPRTALRWYDDGDGSHPGNLTSTDVVALDPFLVNFFAIFAPLVHPAGCRWSNPCREEEKNI